MALAEVYPPKGWWCPFLPKWARRCTLWLGLALFVTVVTRIGEAANPGPPTAFAFDDPVTELDSPSDSCSWADGDPWEDGPPGSVQLDAADPLPTGFAPDRAAGFSSSAKFVGPVSGWVFKLGSCGLGYYVDERPAVGMAVAANIADDDSHRLAYLQGVAPVPGVEGGAGPTVISLVDLVPAVVTPQAARRRPRTKQRKRRRSLRRSGSAPPRPIQAALGESKSCTDHRAYGLWAIDSLNCNAMSTGQSYLEDTAADVVLLQELRVRGDSLLAAQRRAARAKWSLAAEPAAPTDAGSLSAGVGIAVRSHVGLCPVAGLASLDPCRSRVAVTHMGAICSGGIFLVSAYFWCNEGASQRNLELLQCIAQLVRQLHGPWIMAADFNFPPKVLESTGWLRLVGGSIVSTGLATCKGAAEDDYFVIDARLRGAIVGVALIHDTGSRPHSAVRIWVKGRPRRDMVRSLAAPAKAEAFLPHGCLPSDAGEGWDDIAAHSHPGDFTPELLDQGFTAWITKVERQIAGVAGFSLKERSKFCTRAGGPKFVLQCALGCPGSNCRRLSAITVAWRTVAGWLTDIAQALGAGASAQAVARARRVQWLFVAYSWEYLGEGVHATAFRQWVAVATSQGWHDRVRVNWLRATADLISQRATAHDNRLSDAAWASWLHDGPCKSLGRHHRLSRVASGWVPSPAPQSDPLDDADADDTDISQAELDTGVLSCSASPLSMQAEVDTEAHKWGLEWACDSPLTHLPWPRGWGACSPLPDLAVEALQAAARTFPAGTGLGWDKLHPRAVSRCDAGALRALLRLLLMAEFIGDWPSSAGVVLICLLAKPDGGRRPIGLLPSVIRWWMRARLDVVRAWQASHERPYFYAGPRKGAEVAAWKQAARAELAHYSSMLCHANAMLDLVKAFERVPHHWLVRQSERYRYPMAILRLSIAAYRLSRCITIEGVCSVLLQATRGITAGAVHATIELRLLLIQWLDETVSLYRHIVVTVYVDDTSFEASGSERIVCSSVVGAVRHFTQSLIEVGMEFSHTKNVILASSRGMACGIACRLRGLKFKVVGNAKSLGGAISSGRTRNAALLAKRLSDFKVRQPRFQKLRRWIGARKTAAVLRSGGTAALVYGQANTGVSDTTLQAQRAAVAAASVPGGSGELDIALLLADGSMRGKADPAFAAHEAPIGKWAEALWEAWLPRPALQKLVSAALADVAGRPSPWARVRGPAAAFVASALRLGWQIQSYFEVVTDLGQYLDLTRDPPAMTLRFVQQAVWRWRWRRVERQHPHLVRGSGGHGLFVQPIFKLLGGKVGEHWGPSEMGALRSAFANRQWPQARLYRAGLASSPNCRLCVRAGLCDPMDDDPRFTGHLAHRILTCPATAPFRRRMAPAWIQAMVREHTDSDGGLSLSSDDLDLLTRAIAPSPASAIDPPPRQESFEWVVPPDPCAVQVNAYVDGSRLDGEADLHGLCARHGWAFAAYDGDHKLVAAAHGRTPHWATGIHATELWGLLMAVQSCDPGAALKVDCAAVQLGTQRDLRWATAPCRALARAWGPLSAALQPDPDRVIWMPAHCTDTGYVGKSLGNGQPLQAHDVAGNDYVDALAKQAARRDAVPRAQVRMVRAAAERLRDAALWIGRATAFANHCPLDSMVPVAPGAKRQYLRDSEAERPRRPRARKRKAAEVAVPPRGPSESPGSDHEFVVAESRPVRAAPVLTAAVAWQRERAKRARTAARVDAAREDAAVAAWVASRPLRLPAAPCASAAERMAALRAAVAARVDASL